jgi:hypothetical protein
MPQADSAPWIEIAKICRDIRLDIMNANSADKTCTDPRKLRLSTSLRVEPPTTNSHSNFLGMVLFTWFHSLGDNCTQSVFHHPPHMLHGPPKGYQFVWLKLRGCSHSITWFFFSNATQLRTRLYSRIAKKLICIGPKHGEWRPSTAKIKLKFLLAIMMHESRRPTRDYHKITHIFLH